MRPLIELDSEKLKYHPGVLKELWDHLHDENDIPKPLTIEISPIRACNFRCIYCAVDYRLEDKTPARLDQKFINLLIQDVSAWEEKPGIVWAGEGEPTLHPGLEGLVLSASKGGLHQGISTNGTGDVILRILKHLSWSRFTIDALNPTLYAKIHRIDNPHLRAEVFERIEKCVKLNTRCDLGIQAVVFEENVEDLLHLANFSKELGVRYFVAKPYSRHPKSTHISLTSPSEAQLGFLEREFAKISTDSFTAVWRGRAAEAVGTTPRFKRCWAAPLFMFIDADGLVYPCVQYVGDRREALGSLEFQRIGEIIEGTKYRELIEAHLKERFVADCRRGCRLYAVNEYIEELITDNPHHAFI